jgi:hypothetical protein
LAEVTIPAALPAESSVINLAIHRLQMNQSSAADTPEELDAKSSTDASDPESKTTD